MRPLKKTFKYQRTEENLCMVLERKNKLVCVVTGIKKLDKCIYGRGIHI